MEAKRAGMAAPIGSPTAAADVLHGAHQTGKTNITASYQPTDTGKGRFVALDPDAPAPNLVKRVDPKTGDVVWKDAFFLPSIDRTLRASKMPTVFSTPGGTQDLYPQAAKAKQFLEEGLGSGRAPDPSQPFTFPNLELVKRTLNKFSKEADPRDAEIIRKMIIQDETRKELENQMVYKQIENENDQRERRRKEKTSFGPEEDEILYQLLHNRKKDNLQATKEDLEDLIKERQNRSDFVHQLERSLDQNMVDQVTQAFHDEQRERKALDYQRKQDYKNSWIEQAIINEKVREVDNLFN
jgi:hypothetical protein